MTFWNTFKLLFRKYFIAGLLVIIPLFGTFWILKTIVLSIDDLFLSLLPDVLHPKVLIGHNIPGLGLMLTIPIILMMGVLTRLYLGRQMLKAGDWVLSKIPVGNAVYHGLKQLLQTVFGQGSGQYSQVVLVEFPYPGTYALGFVTGDADEIPPSMSSERYIRVYVPTSPNPTSGYLLMIKASAAIATAMSVEEASKLIISGGLVSGKSHG